MSMRELDRLKTIQRVVDRMLRVSQAAEGLGISCRQLERLVRRYQAGGAAGLVSAKCGRPSNNQLNAGVASRAVALIRQRYPDFGPTLACEKLRELHGVSLSKETVRKLMIEAGLWKPRRQRAAQIHQPRNRRACVGELIQIDGSDHAWFEDRAEACTLLVYIDDATSRLMQLHFVPTESTFAYFEATRAYLERHGKPVAFYSDKASVFRSTQESREAGRGVTQFGRVLYELNIDSWCANSSQAKGRVERANLTLQDRLVKELRLRGISSSRGGQRLCPSLRRRLQQALREAAQEQLRRPSPAACRRGPGSDLYLARAAQGVDVPHPATRPSALPAPGHAGCQEADPSVHRRLRVPRWPHRVAGRWIEPGIRPLRQAALH
jgi:transposase